MRAKAGAGPKHHVIAFLNTVQPNKLDLETLSSNGIDFHSLAVVHAYKSTRILCIVQYLLGSGVFRPVLHSLSPQKPYWMTVSTSNLTIAKRGQVQS